MTFTLDDIDRSIIEELRRQPNETSKAIAARVGMSDVGVSTRIRRLIENNVIRATLFHDTDALGLPLYCLFEISVAGRSAKDVGGEIAQIADLQTVAVQIGRPDIQVLFFARDHLHIEEMRGKLGAVPGVDTIDIVHSTKIIKYMTTYGAYAKLRHDRDAE